MFFHPVEPEGGKRPKLFEQMLTPTQTPTCIFSQQTNMALFSSRYGGNPEISKLSSYGTATSIPDFDVCRLSFYLKCCTIGVGLETGIPTKLVDYANAHRLTGHLQLCILKLCVQEFNPERLVCRSYFIDDQHRLLPYHMSNAFYEIESASSFFQINQQEIEVRKIMLCTTAWLNEIYFQSVKSMQMAFRNVSTRGACGTLHCVHCRGFGSDCTCEVGCPASQVSYCNVVHHGFICDGCRKGYIQGSRYRCLVCPCCDLCAQCYLGTEHDQTHAFEKVARVGTPPKLLCPRARLVDLKDNPISIENVPLAIAIPIETATPCDES